MSEDYTASDDSSSCELFSNDKGIDGPHHDVLFEGARVALGDLFSHRRPLPPDLPATTTTLVTTGAFIDALDVGDGWLLARHMGEWGGGLDVVDRQGTITPLHGHNTLRLARLGEDIVAISRSSLELGMDILIRIHRVDGMWRVTPLVELPPELWASAAIAGRTDVLLFGSSRIGIAIHADGHIQPLPCWCFDGSTR